MGKSVVLYLEDDIRWNHEFSSRPEFIRALKERTFGDFLAVYRPFWNTGGENGSTLPLLAKEAARSLDPNQFVDANKNLAPISLNPRDHALGVIGFGQIGRCTAEKIYLALIMKMIYHDVVQMPRELESVSDATYHKSMDTLLTVSGCVVVATPFSGETLF
ncbi:uncharacterized protein N7477_005546 [Penicillium maclennaniae]|uniref:uncharacterized protein n=1 Tax=Penicillium maclennaniae TaxID=1343394 RepID=UPI0025419AED|nr:uncharacterized protein N7477_005546 [Penicillium maclennaniae]KAJ5670183.1 hypothetical protein N7477_005546 [Penicillium maclennaniae]